MLFIVVLKAVMGPVEKGTHGYVPHSPFQRVVDTDHTERACAGQGVGVSSRGDFGEVIVVVGLPVSTSCPLEIITHHDICADLPADHGRVARDGLVAKDKRARPSEQFHRPHRGGLVMSKKAFGVDVSIEEYIVLYPWVWHFAARKRQTLYSVWRKLRVCPVQEDVLLTVVVGEALVCGGRVIAFAAGEAHAYLELVIPQFLREPEPRTISGAIAVLFVP